MGMQPKLRFKGFTDDWEKRKLLELATFSKGQGYSKKDLVSSGYPIILYGRLYTNYQVSITTVNDTFVANNKNAVISEIGDVIVPGSGETAEDISRASSINIAGIILGGDLNVIHPYQDRLDSTFLALNISNGVQQKELTKRAQGKSIVHIHNSDLQTITLKKPELYEQQKISKLFIYLDNLITVNQRKVDLLKKKKNGYLQKLFPENGQNNPELRFKGYTDAWEKRKLGSMGTTYSGLSGKTKEDFGHGNAKFVTYMNVFSNTISKIDGLDSIEIDNKQHQVRNGDVFFTTSSETPNEVGMSSVWTFNIPNIYLNSFTFAYRPTETFDLNYLAFMLRSPLIRRSFIKLAQGISRYNISKVKVMEISVPVPKLIEQKKIGELFHNLDNLITVNQRKVDLLKKEKKALLQKMFI